MKNFLLLAILCVNFFAAAQDENDYNIYKTRNMEIITLADVQSRNNPSILIGATPDMIKGYIPEGTFPNAVNAFLVKMNGQNILFDTGTGAKVADLLSELSVFPQDIDYIFLTHMHGDHIGGMLKNGNALYPNAQIYVALPEYNYWMNEAEMNKQPENKRKNFELVRSVMEQYQGRINHFQPGDFIYPTKLVFDILAIGAYGHTPGHTMFLIHDGDEQVLIWGDLTHALDIQMAHPEVAVTYDLNPQEAIVSRKNILQQIKNKNIVVAGMHIPFPGMGKVSEIKTDSYKFTFIDRQ